MLKTIRLLLIISILASAAFLSAADRHIHTSAGLGGSGLPLYVAKSAGIFDRYGLHVDLLVIPGGPLGMQTLLSGNTQSANIAAMTPIRTVLAGADIVMVGGHLNRQMFNLVTRKEISKPEDLRGKKIGVASLAGTNAVALRLVLKEWKIPIDAVNLLVVGGSPTQLAGLGSGTIDAAVLTYGVTREAVRKGMTVLADLSKPVPEFPDRTIMTRRSFLAKERSNIKRFMQALSEAIYQIKTADERKREEFIAIAGKHLRVNLTAAREFYDLYEDAFSFPPRVGRKGMAAVIDLIQEETGRPKADFDINRFLDESVLDELEKEGFFKKLESEHTRR